MSDPYNLLGVPRDASSIEIRLAYHRAAKSAHPDMGGSSQTFIRLARAFGILTDPAKRAAFDQGSLHLDDNFNETAHGTSRGPSAEQSAANTERERRRDEEAEQQARSELKQELEAMKNRFVEMLNVSATLSNGIVEDRLKVFNPKILEYLEKLAAGTRTEGDNTLNTMNDAAAAVSDFVLNKPMSYIEKENERDAAQYRIRLKLHQSLQYPTSAVSLYIAAAQELKECLKAEGLSYVTVARLVETGNVTEMKAQVASVRDKARPSLIGKLLGTSTKNQENTAAIFNTIDTFAMREKAILALKQEFYDCQGTEFTLTCGMYKNNEPEKPIIRDMKPVKICPRELHSIMGKNEDKTLKFPRLEKISIINPDVLERILHGYRGNYDIAEIEAALSAENRDKIIHHTQEKLACISAYADLFKQERDTIDDIFARRIEGLQTDLRQGIQDIDQLIHRLNTGASSEDIAREETTLASVGNHCRRELGAIKTDAYASAHNDFDPFIRNYHDPVEFMKQNLVKPHHTTLGADDAHHQAANPAGMTLHPL